MPETTENVAPVTTPTPTTPTPDPRDQEVSRLTKALQDRQNEIASRDAELAKLKKAEEDAKLSEAQRIEAHRKDLEAQVLGAKAAESEALSKATMADMKLILVADAEVSTSEFAETIARKFLKEHKDGGDVVAFAKGLKADARWAPLFRGASGVTVADVAAPGKPQGGTSRAVAASLLTEEDRADAARLFPTDSNKAKAFLANLERTRAARSKE